jgi:hypothetical protein
LLGDGSISLCLLIPQYDYLTILIVYTDFHTCSYQCFCSFAPLFPCIYESVVVRSFYHIFLCIVLLPVLGMLILCGLLSHQIFGKVCIYYLSVCSIILLRGILFVTLGHALLLLLHFQFLLLVLPSIAIGTCLLHL